jgi:hypothetical protein
MLGRPWWRGSTVRAGSKSVYAQLASHYYEQMSAMADARAREHQTGAESQDQ